MSANSNWHRVRIRCELECITPVHVGDGKTGKGDSSFFASGGWPLKPEKKADFEYARMTRDEGGNPFIPATTLRGSLRARCDDENLREAIFGSDPGKQETRAGLLRRLEVRCKGGCKTTLSRHVAIHPVTGAADARKLYTFETVPPGTRFKLTIELRSENRDGTPLTTDLVNRFIHLLYRWDGGPASALGGKTSRAFGRIALVTDQSAVSVKGIGFAEIGAWFSEKNGSNPVKALESQFIKLKIDEADKDAREDGEKSLSSRSSGFEIVLYNLSPFLVHDSRWVRDKPVKDIKALTWLKQKSNENEGTPEWFRQAVEDANILPEELEEEEGMRILGLSEEESIQYLFDNLFLPDLEYARDEEGNPVIPATSLAGCFRHQARRILKTLAWFHLKQSATHKAADQIADELTARLFGEETWQSLIGFEDGRLKPREEDFKHCQTFIAVDRFTGGVAEKKLYQVCAVAPGCRFRLSIHSRAPKRIKPWMLGLLALVLRDLHHGKFTLGWGAHRGYGRFRLELEGGKTLEQTIEDSLTTWQDIKAEQTDTVAVEKWVDGLNSTVKERTAVYHGEGPPRTVDRREEITP